MMKFLLTFLILITTTCALQKNDHQFDIPSILRSVTTHIHHVSDPTLAASSRQDLGLNFDTCSEERRCAPPRVCVKVTTPEPDSGTSFQCVPTTSPFCSTSDECDEGESCATVKGNGSGTAVCLSNVVIEASDVITAVEDKKTGKGKSKKDKKKRMKRKRRKQEKRRMRKKDRRMKRKKRRTRRRKRKNDRA